MTTTQNEEKVKLWQKLSESPDTRLCRPTLAISKKEIEEPITDFYRINIYLEGTINMPTEYKASDLERIVENIDTFDLAEETIEIIEYSLEEAKEVISELLKSEDRSYSILEISDRLMMDLALAHRALAELEKEGKIV